jgi:hypothetical protein
MPPGKDGDVGHGVEKKPRMMLRRIDAVGRNDPARGCLSSEAVSGASSEVAQEPVRQDRAGTVAGGLWRFGVRSAVCAIYVVDDEAYSGFAVAADRPDGSFAGAAGRQNTYRMPQATGPIQAMSPRPRSTPGRREVTRP